MSRGRSLARTLKRLGAFALACALTLFVGLPALLVALVMLHSVFGWESAEVDLGRGERLVFQQLVTHPLLAEYEYRIRLERDGATALASDLYPNLGGRTFARLWREPDSGRLLLDGHNVYAWIDLERLCVSPGTPEADDNYPDALNPRCPDGMARLSDRAFTFGVLDTPSGGLQFHPQEPARTQDFDRWGWRHYQPVPLPSPDTRLRVSSRTDGPYQREDGYLRIFVEQGRDILIELRASAGTFGAFADSGIDLFWYPASPAGGPFLRIHQGDGWLLDLGSRTIFRCLSQLASLSETSAPGQPILLRDTFDTYDVRGGTAERRMHLLLFPAGTTPLDRDDPTSIFLRSDDDTRFLGKLRLGGHDVRAPAFDPARSGRLEEAFEDPWQP